MDGTCTFLQDLLDKLKRCTDPVQMAAILNTIEDVACAPCTMYTDSTDVTTFACLWLADGGEFPLPENCPILTVISGCTQYQAVNDPENCDLGECPAAPGTGTDWQEIGSPNAGAFTRAILIVHNADASSPIPIGVASTVPMTIIDVQEAGSGTYNTSTGRWTCNAAGWYRFYFRALGCYKLTAGAVPNVYNGSVVNYHLLNGITLLSNEFARNDFGGNTNFTSLGQEFCGGANMIDMLYLAPGDFIDFGLQGISTQPANVTEWRIQAAGQNSSSLIIERLF